MFPYARTHSALRSGELSRTVLTADRDFSGIDQLARQLLAHLVTDIIVKSGQAAGRERATTARSDTDAESRQQVRCLNR
jgi:hypothetical protein